MKERQEEKEMGVERKVTRRSGKEQKKRDNVTKRNKIKRSVRIKRKIRERRGRERETVRGCTG